MQLLSVRATAGVLAAVLVALLLLIVGVPLALAIIGGALIGPPIVYRLLRQPLDRADHWLDTPKLPGRRF